MEWKEWQPIYQDIVIRLGLESSMDVQATELLSKLLKNVNPNPLLQLLDQKIRDKTVVVCGAGPSLENHVQILKERSDYQDLVFVAADGAVSLLLDQKCPCDIIVTDLDGDYNHIKQASQNGALVVVHGHGDNIDKIRKLVLDLGQVLGSTQVKPTEGVFLWGGFTDGDRACYLVTTYSPAEIILAGMDFGEVVGKWSKPSQESHFEAPQRKLIKLRIARELISTLFEKVDIPYTILEGIPKIDVEEWS
ncbi:MAG: 6-hydroxymethylpterin diphosphokinase MptE-like protein [Candidatus Thorarchaeota archaeon]